MKAIVWGKDNCPFCDKAKNLLIQNGYEIEERKIGRGFTREQLLEEVPDARSVPQVFLEESQGWILIGGYDALVGYMDVRSKEV